MAEIRRRDELFFQKIDSLKLELSHVRGDGNCFYRAISASIFSTPEKHHIVRNICSHFLLLKSNYYAPFLATPEYIHYIQQTSQNGEFGSNIEIHALSWLLDRPITVYSDQPHVPVVTIVGESPSPDTPPIILAHRWNSHFDLLFEKRKPHPIGIGKNSLVRYTPTGDSILIVPSLLRATVSEPSRVGGGLTSSSATPSSSSVPSSAENHPPVISRPPGHTPLCGCLQCIPFTTPLPVAEHSRQTGSSTSSTDPRASAPARGEDAVAVAEEDIRRMVLASFAERLRMETEGIPSQQASSSSSSSSSHSNHANEDDPELVAAIEASLKQPAATNGGLVFPAAMAAANDDEAAEIAMASEISMKEAGLSGKDGIVGDDFAWGGGGDIDPELQTALQMSLMERLNEEEKGGRQTAGHTSSLLADATGKNMPSILASQSGGQALPRSATSTPQASASGHSASFPRSSSGSFQGSLHPMAGMDGQGPIIINSSASSSLSGVTSPETHFDPEAAMSEEALLRHLKAQYEQEQKAKEDEEIKKVLALEEQERKKKEDEDILRVLELEEKERRKKEEEELAAAQAMSIAQFFANTLGNLKQNDKH
ncbi:putative OTU domain-containing protein 5 [Monocercomonoides exilis]|uniref:putative OTU domain-containing protein 5 n=1 Tax=Monocercomonoides exilis TaxID=2049356 RepID=UPI00355A5468|nr:putative OTU domain-containing protein 5 [Monocercomonoides exilis]|eukprot:MONOS_4510.1-p1 / transcript=MONOS_4510.1 / gene=MONOS_4510 / organism=Monocercomonoides_exilis_PA203 / gene_product=unspecified product / transcript_product=unspecified product / location=Mono_scaffold00121:11787-13707(+) / protein_length=596 / sequence_SO=supercontig / SO=protein_coding / is_pseudo=false